MISAIGNKHLSKTSYSSGFSIIEILIVLGFFSLLAGLVVVNFDALVSSYTQKPIEAEFWEALAQTRQKAIENQIPAELSYDTEAHEFVIRQAHEIEKIAIQGSTDSLKITFHIRLPAKTIEEAFEPEMSEWPIAAISCDARGVCPPSGVVIEQSDGRIQAWIDPFSAMPLYLQTNPSVD